RKIADNIIGMTEGRSSLFDSKPLNDAQMELLAKGQAVKAGNNIDTVNTGTACRGCSSRTLKNKVTTEKNILSYCATSGAVHGCSSITDAIVIIHGPRSCAHIMSSMKTISEIIRGSKRTIEEMHSLRMVSTDIDDTVSVFGGAGLLEEKIRDMILEGQKNIFIVTSCIPGIIGDNTIDVVNAISLEYPDIYFRVIEADGNITGDWEDGVIEAADAILDIVDDSVKPRDDTVNILAERYFFKRGEDKDKDIFRLFDPFGIKVNCRFLYEASMESIRNFRLGKMSYIADNDSCSVRVARIVHEKLGVPVDTEPLPIGIRAYKRFSKKVGEEFGIEEKAAEAAAEEERKYYAEIAKIKPRLEGKRVIIENRFHEDIDWLIELVTDLGMEIVLVELGQLNTRKEKSPESRYASSGILFRDERTYIDVLSDIKEFSPDIILSNTLRAEYEETCCIGYSNPGPGMKGILNFGKKIGNLMLIPKTEGWRDIR
ncbi:MAG: nitrogenase component 1, partial [Candidatus Methanoplasma sp.]|nr:nitrogenase component 1 [Candidatus Methanoplasma sp.]